MRPEDYPEEVIKHCKSAENRLKRLPRSKLKKRKTFI
jgi:hypothetical protein